MDAAAGHMPLEIAILGWSVVLLLAQLILQASTASLELGLPYALGPRDAGRKPRSAHANRTARAFYNLLETYAAFVGLALALAVTGKAGGSGALGAEVWFWSRVVYVPIFIAGIPVIRTLVWLASIVGLVMMLARLLS
jgi:uncharacterized MAPEG superfamily protein